MKTTSSSHKEHRTEQLLSALGDVDPRHLEEALLAKTPAELQRLSCTAPASPASKRRRPRRLWVACACALLAICTAAVPLLLLPLLRSEPTLPPAQEVPTPLPPESDMVYDGAITSLDHINYLAALQLLSLSHTDAAVPPAPGVVLLGLSDEGIGYDTDKDRDEPILDAPVEVPVPPSSESGEGQSQSGTAGSPSESIYYYSISPDDRFDVYAAIYFCVELVDPNGFLASRLGVGTVEVVITNNSLEPMITFRRGDRFYSCLNNGGGSGKMDFSTHKYIEGFHIVKNLAQDNYRFDVSFGLTCVESVECSRFKGGDGVSSLQPDTMVLLPNESVWTEVSGSFTIDELNEMVGKVGFPESPFPEVTPPPSQEEPSAPPTDTDTDIDTETDTDTDTEIDTGTDTDTDTDTGADTDTQG